MSILYNLHSQQLDLIWTCICSVKILPAEKQIWVRDPKSFSSPLALLVATTILFSMTDARSRSHISSYTILGMHVRM